MKTKSYPILTICLTLLIWPALACGLGGTDPNQQEATIAVALTQTAALATATPTIEAPTEMATPEVGATPTASPEPDRATETPVPACQDNAVHVAGAGYYEPFFGEPALAEEVRLQNTGTCPWDSRYSLAFASGDELPGLGPVYVQDTVAVGAEGVFIIDLEALPLEANTYQSTWQMHDPNGLPFGEPVTFEIFIPVYNPNAFRAADPPQGAWTIDRYVFGAVSSWGETAAQAQIGKTLVIQPEEITFDGQTCYLYPPDVLLEEAASYLDSQYRTTPAAVGIPDGSIDVIRTFCDIPGVYEFMRVQYPEGPSLIMNIQGVFFFLKFTDTVVPPVETPGLSIDSFTVDVEDIPTGKRLTFNWQTTGASAVRILSGTSQRFPSGWDNLSPSGSHTVELSVDTNYKHPAMTLIATNAQGEQVSQSVRANWPCQYSDQFRGNSTPAGTVCPSAPALHTPAAEQRFQNGFMIWLGALDNGTILVFYDDETWERFNDTWQSGEPESAPALVPPASGLHQPVRGFGKVWRENQWVQDKLGWAVEEEQGFDGIWQRDKAESLSDTKAHLVNCDFRLIGLYGPGSSGTWEYRMLALD